MRTVHHWIILCLIGGLYSDIRIRKSKNIPWVTGYLTDVHFKEADSRFDGIIWLVIENTADCVRSSHAGSMKLNSDELGQYNRQTDTVIKPRLEWQTGQSLLNN